MSVEMTLPSTAPTSLESVAPTDSYGSQSLFMLHTFPKLLSFCRGARHPRDQENKLSIARQHLSQGTEELCTYRELWLCASRQVWAGKPAIFSDHPSLDLLQAENMHAAIRTVTNNTSYITLNFLRLYPRESCNYNTGKHKVSPTKCSLQGCGRKVRKKKTTQSKRQQYQVNQSL